MTAGIWFWIIFVISVLFCGFGTWSVPEPHRRYVFGGSLVLLVLMGLLGWGIFGAPLK